MKTDTSHGARARAVYEQQKRFRLGHAKVASRPMAYVFRGKLRFPAGSCETISAGSLQANRLAVFGGTYGVLATQNILYEFELKFPPASATGFVPRTPGAVLTVPTGLDDVIVKPFGKCGSNRQRLEIQVR